MQSMHQNVFVNDVQPGIGAMKCDHAHCEAEQRLKDELAELKVETAEYPSPNPHPAQNSDFRPAACLRLQLLSFSQCNH